ncbi:STN domain-containing protein [Pseudomonas qingdaonensis]|nr:STN domain-containing protein [Pseudomonas qingdaonensis]
MNNNKVSKRWLPLALALAVSGGIANSYADSAPTSIQIQAQPLAAALGQLGRQTSLQLFFSPDLVAGKQAPAVSGNLAPNRRCRPCCRAAG